VTDIIPQLHTEVQYELHHQRQIQTGRCVLMRERDNYLDEEIETVSAQQTGTVEVPYNHSLYANVQSLKLDRAESMDGGRG
jgi:hypothetical protein